MHRPSESRDTQLIGSLEVPRPSGHAHGGGVECAEARQPCAREPTFAPECYYMRHTRIGRLRHTVTLTPALRDSLAPAYRPCASFASVCSSMRWNPARGHVPRGFAGGAGELDEVELVLVFAEPGDPYAGEGHSGLDSTYAYTTDCFRTGHDLFHRNVRDILNLCWPRVAFEEQMRCVWLTESVLCSAKTEGGAVNVAVARQCAQRYLSPQLALFPNALVVALGRKAQQRLRAVGFDDFLPVYAVAPPGCNRRGARESWERIPVELERHRAR